MYGETHYTYENVDTKIIARQNSTETSSVIDIFRSILSCIKGAVVWKHQVSITSFKFCINTGDGVEGSDWFLFQASCISVSMAILVICV